MLSSYRFVVGKINFDIFISVLCFNMQNCPEWFLNKFVSENYRQDIVNVREFTYLSISKLEMNKVMEILTNHLKQLSWLAEQYRVQVYDDHFLMYILMIILVILYILGLIMTNWLDTHLYGSVWKMTDGMKYFLRKYFHISD